MYDMILSRCNEFYSDECDIYSIVDELDAILCRE